jgi:hypothetical protein
VTRWISFFSSRSRTSLSRSGWMTATMYFMAGILPLRVRGQSKRV